MRHRNDVDWERERKLNTIKNLAVNEICPLASVRVRVGLSRETDKVLRTTERERERNEREREREKLTRERERERGEIKHN